MNGDWVLETLTVTEGEIPKYSGETPTKEPTAQYTYEFKGWELEIVAATEDASNIAVFDEILREYTVTFKNGEEVLRQTQVTYGAVPKYDGTEPTKEATSEHSYKFKGWDHEIVAVTGDTTYTAVFDEIMTDTPPADTHSDNTILWVILCVIVILAVGVVIWKYTKRKC